MKGWSPFRRPTTMIAKSIYIGKDIVCLTYPHDDHSDRTYVEARLGKRASRTVEYVYRASSLFFQLTCGSDLDTAQRDQEVQQSIRGDDVLLPQKLRPL